MLVDNFYKVSDFGQLDGKCKLSMGSKKGRILYRCVHTVGLCKVIIETLEGKLGTVISFIHLIFLLNHDQSIVTDKDCDLKCFETTIVYTTYLHFECIAMPFILTQTHVGNPTHQAHLLQCCCWGTCLKELS